MMRTMLALAIAGALLAGCAGANGGDGGDAEGRLRVVATTTQVGSVAEEVGGDAIDLTVLLEPGVEAHDFELTPAQGAALEEADLVLVSGAGLEDWLTDTLASAGATERVRDLSEGIELREPAEAGHEHEDEHAEDEHAEDEHAEDGAEHEHEGEDTGHEGEDTGHEGEGEDAGADEGHDHGDIDPHYWLSAPNAIRMVENARDALTEAAPADAAGFEERAAALIGRLETADAEIRDLIGQLPADARAIVTDHDALGYFIDEYGLEYVGSVFPSLDVSSEPSAREIEHLIEEIEAHDVRAIFTESSVNAQLAAAVASETDATLVEDPLYTDSLGPEGSGAETLDGMLLHNARVIHDALAGG